MKVLKRREFRKRIYREDIKVTTNRYLKPLFIITRHATRNSDEFIKILHRYTSPIIHFTIKTNSYFPFEKRYT